MTWEAALTEFESKIATAELCLREGHPFPEEILQGFAPPVGLGPFPKKLTEWATAILARNADLTRLMGQAMVALEGEMASNTRESSAAKRYAASADTTVSQYFDKPV